MSDDRDAALVRACRAGDRRAFEELVGRYERPVFNAAYRILHNRDDAKDVTQTVFMKAYEHLDRFDTNQRFFSWIYRIALNEALDVVGGRKGHDDVVDDLVADRPGPEEQVASAELDRGLQGALMALKVEYRTVIVLKHVMGCSYEEIGVALDCPVKTVKSRLFTARQALRDVLVARGMM